MGSVQHPLGRSSRPERVCWHRPEHEPSNAQRLRQEPSPRSACGARRARPTLPLRIALAPRAPACSLSEG